MRWPGATISLTSATTDAPGVVAESAAPAPSATTRSPASTTRTATGRARTTRVTDSTAEPGPVAQVTRELPLVGGRDLPDLVDTAASRTTPPAAVPDTVERPPDNDQHPNGNSTVR